MAPPILKHKKKRLHPGCYWGGTAEFVIPTPSIDQVLQSLASNALASNASDENEDEDDTVENGQEIIQLEEGNNHNEESTSGLITAQPTSSADSLNDILSQAELRRSKRKQTFETQPTKLRVIVTGKKQATRANDTGKQNGCGLSRKFDKSHPTSSSRQHEDMSERTNVIINAAKDIPSSSRTVSDMLNDLIDRSVNQQQQNDIERQMSANNDSIQVSNVSSNVQSIPFIPEARLPNRRPAILVPSTMSQSKQSKSTRTNNAGRVRQVNASEARIAMTVDQVVSSLRKTASSSAAPVSFEQPLHFVIHQAPNTTSQTGNQPIQMQANAVEHDGDDDDIQVVEDEAEIEEVEDEAAPFCKNCANEVPLIIKRLDRLDGMVNRMIRFVKNELNSIPAATPSTGNNPVTTRLITTNNRPITITTPITTLDLEQKIMSGAPDEFDLHALCDRNTFVRGLTFDQLNAALNLLITKGLLTQSTDKNPPIYKKTALALTNI